MMTYFIQLTEFLFQAYKKYLLLYWLLCIFTTLFSIKFAIMLLVLAFSGMIVFMLIFAFFDTDGFDR